MLYTETEFEALYLGGLAPEKYIRITKWAWDLLPAEQQALVLGSQHVVTFDRPHLGTRAVSDGFEKM